MRRVGGGAQASGKSKKTRKRSGNRDGLSNSTVQQSSITFQPRLCRLEVEV